MGLSAKRKAVYALGQFGLVLCAYGVGKLFVSFFVTRSVSGLSSFPAYIPQSYLLGFFTVAGLIIAVTRLFDAGIGLVTGFVSDRSSLKRGRRTGLMALSVIPLAILSAIVFFPPVAHTSNANSIALFASVTLFYFVLSLYTIPYLALLSEYGTSARDRMKLTTMMACMSAVASMIGDRSTWLMSLLSSWFALSPIVAFRAVIVAFASVSCLCMMAPAFLLNEKRYTQSAPAKGGFSAAFGAVVRDSCYRPFLLADVMYRIASAFAIAGFSYYVTVLLGLQATTTVFFLLFIFFMNIAFYYPAYYLVLKYGKRRVLSVAFLMLIMFLTASVFVGTYPFSPFVQGAILSVLIAIPASIFTVIPNAIVADLAAAAEKKTGVQRGGMYFGVHELFSKLGQLVSTLLFPVIIAIGSKPGMGVGSEGLRATLVIAAVLSFIGFIALFGYREKEVASVLEAR